MRLTSFAGVLFCTAILGWPVGAEETEERQKFAAGYWNVSQHVQKRYGMQFEIQLEVSNQDHAEKRISALMKRFKGRLLGSPDAQRYYLGRQQRRLSYEVPYKFGQRASQRLLEIGRVKQFTSRPGINKKKHDDTKKKLTLISKEISQNQEELERMAITRHLLTQIRDRLEAVDESYNRGRGLCLVTITLHRLKE